ncbi:glutamine amidotransferase [Clostridiaceae bacterium UIB06]|uniref:Glutamine amidotransferase n=1 Tax=Clostridium thailandense TaxID=2794346 RepID=A0A949WRF7_9CLOT|nr:glutamine amidotransferase [Clostridium thailandense]MBV7273936.1 glutamine amidotransferase [Clostridium thailandense]MCH5137218.1 glutamine amidotransferase [Clostridiaceae bacterium UIB06]
MKKILIIKTGTTFPSINESYGDFEDFVINQIDLPKKDVIVCSVYKGDILPDLKEISGVIITGSHSMVTDCAEWSVATEKYIRDIANRSIPVLGICYGHQLICQAFGGIVGYHPEGKEIGTVNIELTEEGKKDELLGILPDSFLGHVVHSQTVVKLPADAKLLARNDFEKHHAFVIYGSIWGVQFHPEFNFEITKAYISEQKENLIKEGNDIDELYNSLKEHEYGKMLLKRFIDLI